MNITLQGGADYAAKDAASRTPEVGANSKRLEWLDVAKGIGIILVVIGHSIGGMIDTGTHLPKEYANTFYVIYIFHMDLFFLLSGLLLKDRISRNINKFLSGIFTKIAYPYFLWATIYILVIFAMSSVVNRPLDRPLLQVAILPVYPAGPFWFLHSLFFMHLIAALLVPRVDVKWLLVIAIGIRAMAELSILKGLGPFLQTCIFVPPYMIGVALGTQANFAPKLEGYWRWLVPGVVVLAVAMIALTWSANVGSDRSLTLSALSAAQIAKIAWRFDSLAAGLAAAFAVIALSNYVRGGAGSLLAYLGRASFPIYVLHIIFVAGSRILLMHFGHITDYRIVVPMIVLMGLVGPVIAFEISRKLRVAKALGLA